MNNRIKFTKMHGLGNNYIYIDLVSETIELPELKHLAIKLSNQNTGIGSDGMILILPSESADIRMRVFNKDGSEAKNCGNGLRCVAKYAYDKGLVSNKTFSIETLGGNVLAKVMTENGKVNNVTIDMGEPRFEKPSIPMTGGPNRNVAIQEPVTLSDKQYEVTAVSMGNPHGIFFVADIQNIPIHTVGPLLADGHPLFPEGVNVGYVEIVSDHEINYRVWERGSGITQACGTGACAAAVATVATGKAEKGTPITVHLDGGDLEILWDQETNHIFMTGPAVVICEGVFYL